MSKYVKYTINTRDGEMTVTTMPENITLVKSTRPKDKFTAYISPGIVYDLTEADYKAFNEMLQK